MDKSITNMSITIHSPRFKPWAMNKTQYKINRLSSFLIDFGTRHFFHYFLQKKIVFLCNKINFTFILIKETGQSPILNLKYFYA